MHWALRSWNEDNRRGEWTTLGEFVVYDSLGVFADFGTLGNLVYVTCTCYEDFCLVGYMWCGLG